MQQVISTIGGVVIDEERYMNFIYANPMYLGDSQRTNFSPIKDVYSAQQKVLMLAQAYNCQIFLIQHDKNFPQGDYCYNEDEMSHNWHATKTSLRALLPQDTIVINKHNPNAFVGTNLELKLKNQYKGAGIKNLVINGWAYNVCVAETVGVRVKKCEHFEQGLGAIQYKFTVMTSRYVFNGPPATWAEFSPRIHFHTHL